MSKLIEKKQKEVIEYLSTIKDDDSAFISYYFDKKKFISNRFPEIKSFIDYVGFFKKRLGSKRKAEILEKGKNLEYKRSVTNKDGFIMNYSMPVFLGIDKALYKKIEKTDYALSPAGYESFEKWGKTLKTPYFNFDDALEFKEKRLVPIMEILGEYVKFSRKQVIEKIQELLNSHPDIKSVKLINDVFVCSQKIKTSFADFPFILNVFNLSNELNYYQVNDYENLKKELDVFIKEGQDLWDSLQKTLNEILVKYSFTPKDFLQICNFKNKSTLNIIDVKSSLKKFLIKVNIKVSGDKLKSVFDLENYHNTFPLARSIKRNVKIICGPTNSGKTYEAIEALKKAKSGVYLAPLRLMALEIYDKLTAAGVPCNLKTGDDEIITPGAKHIASTIECIDLSEKYDVAVIDEFQMLADMSRGWAWTQAILGVCASDVYVIGSEAGLSAVTKALKPTGDEVAVRFVKRKSNLVIMPKRVYIRDLQSGDAIVAFSRKDVLEFGEILKRKGFSVSVIYGALAPSVRRKQAQMFLDGETDILVATDAIGMGLNLPIKRIIFTQLKKFNGVATLPIEPSQVRQIAGRAGRYKENGFVGLLSDEFAGRKKKQKNQHNSYWGNENNYKKEPEVQLGIKYLRSCLGQKDNVIEKLYIAPNNYHLKTIAESMETNKILNVLSCFNLCAENDLYSPSYSETSHMIAQDESLGLANLDVVSQYKVCNTPVTISKEEQSFYRVKKIIRKLFSENTPVNKDCLLLNNYRFNVKDTSLLESELKVITAMMYLSKITPLLDMSGLIETRNWLANEINNQMRFRFFIKT